MTGVSCPLCGSTDSEVYDSRPSGRPVPTIRRRRCCHACGHRYATIEILVDMKLEHLVDLSPLTQAQRHALKQMVKALTVSR